MNYEELKTLLAVKRISISDDMVAKLKVYAALLKEWNEKMNLTSIVEEEEVIEKHFYDCLVAAEGMDFSNKKIADMGSGAGFPGMVWAVCFPEADVTLIDATNKKFKFLEEVKNRLNVENVHFHVGRVEAMKEEKETFDIVSARGFAALNVLMEVGAPLLKVGGKILALKGSRGLEELKAAQSGLPNLGLRYDGKSLQHLPTHGDERINIRLLKFKPTPEKYPRDWATIVKHPL